VPTLLNTNNLTVLGCAFRRGGLNVGLAPYRAWAVRDGDSAQVLEPSALVLIAVGIIFGRTVLRV
jgi:hypothetical protein